MSQTINKTPTRATALKTLERLFMMDKAVAKPIETRSKNFKAIPKRRGGQIWTKRPNKVHPELVKGKSATIKFEVALAWTDANRELFASFANGIPTGAGGTHEAATRDAVTVAEDVLLTAAMATLRPR